MTTFDAYALIDLWERDGAISAAEKAALLLQLMGPEQSQDDRAAMTIGQRDRILLQARQQLFGDKLEGMVTCQKCKEKLELELRISDLLRSPPSAPAEAYASLVVDGLDIVFRLPCVVDTLAIAYSGDRDQGNRILVQRCIQSATRDGESLSPDQLPDSVILAVSRHLETLDPLAEIRLSLSCSSCENTESVVLDIATYFWSELIWEAEHLLDEVALLAREYGWRESDILAISGRRRQFYLDRSTQ